LFVCNKVRNKSGNEANFETKIFFLLFKSRIWGVLDTKLKTKYGEL
jgi:hypothetical protein